VRCLGDATSGSRFNVGTGIPTSVGELHRLLTTTCGVQASPVMAPARPGELQAVSLDSSALTDRTGWRPSVPLRDGLKQTVAWVRSAIESSGGQTPH
jgi:UDP-glucose 4-epimerase